MDFEKMYNDLKKEHETLSTTFDSYKTTSQEEKEELEKKLVEKDEIITSKEDKIKEVQQTNIDLYLKIPQTQEQNKPSVEEKTTEQILKEIGDNI